MYSTVFLSETKMQPPLVTVAQGTLQGKINTSYNGKEYYSFEGIPYAAPPVGNFRFQGPQELESWQGIRDATKPGHKCAQMDPYGKKSLDGSEDCLYLNIYTPKLPENSLEKLPVLVFAHGGRFIVGNGHYYQPDYFIDNDVILVTINYRLHILGFLCLNVKEAPGNAAFKDVCFALKWVKKNIVNFNGDCTNVTAFGESAGAGLISSLITSKMADGLVDKIIAESGVCLSDLMIVEEDPIEKAKHVASLLGKELNDPKDLHDFLIQAPVEDLVFASTMAELSRPPHIINAYFLPVVEKKFEGVDRYFEEYPLITMRNNRQRKIPILIGCNSHEGAFFAQKDENGQIRFIKDLQRFIPRYLFIPHNSERSRKIADSLHEFYFQRKEIDENTKTEYINLTSDAYFNRDINMYAELNSKENNVYFYNFKYSGNMNTRVMSSLGIQGATHGDILQYQFYREVKAKRASAMDKKIVEFLSEAWCNFARDGKPSTKNNPIEWLPYTRDQHLCMNIDEQITLTEYPNWHRIKHWLNIMGERSRL